MAISELHTVLYAKRALQMLSKTDKPHGADKADFSSSVYDLYSETARFDSRPQHLLVWELSEVFPFPPGKFWNSA
jgi:hypothetical protein